MSIHEIDTVQRWRITCEMCRFCARAPSAGEAERLSIEHIEFTSLDGDQPHYSHVTTIAQVTHVGRNP